MGIIESFLHTYSQFFNLNMWIEIFTDPVQWSLIGTLILMEGLLSADNAIALSVQVSHLPEKDRKKALTYGVIGAYVFRFIAIGLGTTLVKLWGIKGLGGFYLLWMAYKHFRDKRIEKAEANSTELTEEEKQARKLERLKKGMLARRIGVFWATVVSVEAMDITFSVDSVLAAFGVSETVGILLLGGMLGILMMRGVAQLFTKLVERVPELETTAYVIVGFIGLKMVLSIVHNVAELFGVSMHEIEVTHLQFFIFLGLSFLVTYIVHIQNKKKEALAG